MRSLLSLVYGSSDNDACIALIYSMKHIHDFHGPTKIKLSQFPAVKIMTVIPHESIFGISSPLCWERSSLDLVFVVMTSSHAYTFCIDEPLVESKHTFQLCKDLVPRGMNCSFILKAGSWWCFATDLLRRTFYGGNLHFISTETKLSAHVAFIGSITVECSNLSKSPDCYAYFVHNAGQFVNS